MAVDNFFRLNYVHEVITRFSHDHEHAMNLHQSSYEYIENIEKLIEGARKKDSDPIDVMIKFNRKLSHAYAELSESYYNMLYSYFVFKTAAQTNSIIMQEFRKLPESIDPLSEHFNKLLGGYRQILQNPGVVPKSAE